MVASALLLAAFEISDARAAEPVIGAGAFPDVAWRLVGPFRGGWTPMAVGVPTEPDTYYFAAAGGGVWKTTDSGRTWLPTTDAQPITGVGALAVAPSDARIVYAGTGHPEPRYDVIAGSGVYGSRDAGKTWQSLGLGDTRHIGAIAGRPFERGPGAGRGARPRVRAQSRARRVSQRGRRSALEQDAVRR